MPTSSELQSRVDHLEKMLRDKDVADAQARAERDALEAATAAVTDAATRAEAAKQERETIRRGAWVNHYIAHADQNAPIDFAAIDEAVPADCERWPPGTSEATF